MKTAHEIAEQIQHYLSMRLSASADRTKGIESIIECELRELRDECERFREKLREILLAANLEQQTEGVVQPFVAKWIRKRTAECDQLRKDKDRLDWLRRNPQSVKFIAPNWYSGAPDEKSLNLDKWSSTGQWGTIRAAIDAAMQPSETKERP